MTRSIALALLLLTAAAPDTGPQAAEPGGSATVQVTVTNVTNDRGHVVVAICPKADFTREECPYNGKAPAHPGAVTVTIAGIPPGIYAAQAYQDTNDDGQVDLNFLGMPTEPIGFSRDAPVFLGPPHFDDADFRLQPGTAAISLRLRRF